MPQYAEVALPLPIRQEFTYAIPDELAANATRGSRALAPFGPQKLEGVIVGLRDDIPPEAQRIRPLLDALDGEPFFSDAMLDLCRWVAHEYLASWGEALAAAIPGGMKMTTRRRVWLADGVGAEALEGLSSRAPVQHAILSALLRADGQTVHRLQPAVRGSAIHSPLATLAARGLVRVEHEFGRGAGPRKVLTATLTHTPRQTSELLEELRGRAPKQALALQFLCRVEGAAPVAEVVRQSESSHATIRSLESKGLVVVEQTEEYRGSYVDESGALELSTTPLALNPAQASAVEAIQAATQAGSHETFLLYGVTGSGKTEVYMQTIQPVLDAGKSALVLVPEISLTPQTVTRLVERLGRRVAVLHSRLSGGERHDEWQRIRRREVDIVVGARSAVFAPISNLGIVVMDEEHEGTYKQDEPAPRYHAREVARRRAEQAGAPLVLGSATPALESLYRVQMGHDRMLRMPSRVLNIAMPTVRIVDMREELQLGNATIFSRALREGIEGAIERKEQVILFLNRRGHSTYVFCRDCGYVEMCPDCHVSLTFHRRQDLLLCHHCAHVQHPRETCVECASQRIKHLGLGTQQVEEATREMFIGSRVRRMDADTTTRKGSHGEILQAFRDHEIDILVGTQMIAKGLDFPNVTLVGVILADTTLYMPDFRAAERSFNLLTQVAGRSGRSSRGGDVVFQTYQPQHYSIVAASNHDYDSFSEIELAHREARGYPPHLRAVRLLLKGEDRQEVVESGRRLAGLVQELRQTNAEWRSVIAKGPAPAPLSRVRGQYRWHLLLCSADAEHARSMARAMLERSPKGQTSITVDVDPMNVL
jgi:primosomal protein N' (replication factor Y) (superfamily II helicase)